MECCTHLRKRNLKKFCGLEVRSTIFSSKPSATTFVLAAMPMGSARGLPHRTELRGQFVTQLIADLQDTMRQARCAAQSGGDASLP